MDVLRQELKRTRIISIVSTGLLTLALLNGYLIESYLGTDDLTGMSAFILVLSGFFLMASLFLSFGEINTRGARKIITYPFGIINFFLKWGFFLLFTNVEVAFDIMALAALILSFITWIFTGLIIYNSKRVSDERLEAAFSAWYKSDKVARVSEYQEENHTLRLSLYLTIAFIVFTQANNQIALTIVYAILIALSVLLFRQLYQKVYSENIKPLMYQMVLFSLMVIVSRALSYNQVFLDELWNRIVFYIIMFSIVIFRYFRNNEVVEMSKYQL